MNRFGFVLIVSVALTRFAPAAEPSAALAAQIAALRNSPGEPARLAALKLLAQHAGGVKALVPALAGALQDKSNEIRANAAQALADIGLSARDAAPALARMATDRDEYVRSRVAFALGEIAVPSGEVFCALAFMLNDANPSVRACAAEAFGKFGAPAEHARPFLRELIGDQNKDVALNAALSLATLGEYLPEAARFYALALNSSEKHKTAEAALRAVGAPAVAALAEIVQDVKLDIYPRRDAAHFLSRFGPGAEQAAPALCAVLHDADKELQNRAAQALVELNAAPLDAAPALLRVARDANPEFRTKVYAAFQKLGAPALPAAFAALDSRDDVYLRRETSRLLARQADSFKDNSAPLIERLNDPDEYVRCSLIDAISNSGANPETAIPPMIAMLSDKSGEVRMRACQLLAAQRNDPRVVVALAEARVRDDSTGMKYEAGKAVLSAGHAALPALSVLRGALNHKDNYVVAWALQAIENIGPPAAEAIPEISQRFAASATYRAECLRALGAIGEKSLSTIIDIFKKGDATSRSYASAALGQIGAPALPALLEMLRGENADFASGAATALERMAPASAPAVPDLLAAARSKSDAVRSYSIQALGRLGEHAYPALMAEIRKDDELSRKLAAAALGQMDAMVVPKILDALREEQNADVACAFMDALARQGPKASSAAPLILELAGRQDLGKNRGKIWSYCAYALGNIGAAREESVPVLFEMLATNERSVHSDAYSALLRLSGEDLRIPPLSGALRNAPYTYLGPVLKKFGASGMASLLEEMNSGDAALRDLAAQAFAPMAPECIPFLLAQAEENPGNAINAALVIGEIRALTAERPKASATTAAGKAQEALRIALETATPLLQKMAQGNDPDEAIVALWALSKTQNSGGDVIAAIVSKLVACSPAFQSRGIRALKACDLAKQSRTLVPALPIIFKIANDPPQASLTRRDANQILAAAGYCAESVPRLLAALDEGNAGARAVAADALKNLGPEARSAIPQLIPMLDRPNNSGYLAANAVLNSIGAESIPPLIEALKNENPRRREGALNALIGFKNAKLSPQIGAIASLLDDEREEVCAAALQLIRKLEAEGRPAETKVRALLGRNSDTLFADAADTLKKIGVDLIPALTPYAENQNEEIALRALTKLNAVAQERPREMLPIARKVCKSKSAEVRLSSLSLLGHNPELAAEEMPLILAGMKDAGATVRARCAKWLQANAKVDPAKALPVLVAGLSDPYEKVRRNSNRGLIALADKAAPAVPQIKKLLDDPVREIQVNAATVLVNLGVNDPRATILCNETHAAEWVNEYFEKQDNYLEAHWNDDRVHYFAKTFLETWGSAGKEYASNVDADGIFSMYGYKFKVLHAQGDLAPGGKKAWIVNGLLTGGHALLAWPERPGETGRIAFMSGPDGTVYQRPFAAADLAAIPAIASEFNPGPEWTAGAKPVKPVPAAGAEYFKPKGKANEAMEF